MNDSTFDALLGRVRTTDTTTIHKTQTVQGGHSNTGFATTQLVTAEPATGNDGDLIYNTVTGNLEVWANGAWHVISGGGVVEIISLLTQAGDNRITMTGDYRLTQDQ